MKRIYCVLLSVFISGSALADSAGPDFEQICVLSEKYSERLETRLVYAGPKGQPLVAAADGVVVFFDWVTSRDGTIRLPILIVDYGGCMVAYHGYMHKNKLPADLFKAGDTLAIWGSE